MHVLEKVKDLFLQNKFNEGLLFIESYFDELDPSENQNESIEEIEYKISLLKFKLKIHKILNITDQETFFKKATLEISINEFEESHRTLNQLLKLKNQSHNIKFYKMYIATCIGVGDLEKTSSFGKMYLQELYENKRFYQILDFLETFEKNGGSLVIKKQFELKAIVGLGDIKTLDEIIFKDELDEYLKGKNKNADIYELFLSLVHEKRKYWKKSKSYHDVKIISSWMNIAKTKSKKVFINELFDRLVQYPQERKWYQMILKYSKEFEKKKLGLSVINILESHKDLLNVRLALSKEIKTIKEDLEGLPDIKEEDVEEQAIDLGTDLFSSKNNEENIFDKIKKIERDIQFIKNTGSENHLERLYEELKSLDENHDLLKDHYDDQYQKDSSKVFNRKKNISFKRSCSI